MRIEDNDGPVGGTPHVAGDAIDQTISLFFQIGHAFVPQKLVQHVVTVDEIDAHGPVASGAAGCSEPPAATLAQGLVQKDAGRDAHVQRLHLAP